MVEDMSEKTFNYESGVSLFITRFLAIAVFGFSLLLLFIISRMDPPQSLIVAFTVFSSAMFLGSIVYQYFYPNISIKHNVVKLNYPLNKFNIKTDEIVAIELLDRAFRSSLLRVDVDGLTPIHSIIGNMYRSNGQRSFLVRSDIQRFSELVEILSEKTKIKPKRTLWH